MGQISHTVKTGESISQLADMYGHFWETIWEDPANSDLKAVRKNPETLVPGDIVIVPALREGAESCDTAQRHTFKRKGVPVKVIFAVATRDGTPFAGKSYVMQVGAQKFEGVTDGEGGLEHWVATTEPTAKLTVELDTDGFPKEGVWSIGLRQLQPSDTPEGIQARLRNLGFDCGEIDGVTGPKTNAALVLFQRTHDIEETGEADPETRAELKAKHGC